jgi:hypothetical protein
MDGGQAAIVPAAAADDVTVDLLCISGPILLAADYLGRVSQVRPSRYAIRLRELGYISLSQGRQLQGGWARAGHGAAVHPSHPASHNALTDCRYNAGHSRSGWTSGGP